MNKITHNPPETRHRVARKSHLRCKFSRLLLTLEMLLPPVENPPPRLKSTNTRVIALELKIYRPARGEKYAKTRGIRGGCVAARRKIVQPRPRAHEADIFMTGLQSPNITANAQPFLPAP